MAKNIEIYDRRTLQTVRVVECGIGDLDATLTGIRSGLDTRKFLTRIADAATKPGATVT